MAENELGSHLQRVRRQQHRTQVAIAKACEVSPSVVSKWESGKRRPKPGRLAMIAKAYDLDFHLVLLQAKVVELPGFDKLMERAAEQQAPTVADLDMLLTSASEREKRELVKYLAALRVTSPMLDGLMESESA